MTFARIDRRAYRLVGTEASISTAKPMTFGLDIGRVTNRGLSTEQQRQLASQFDGWIFTIGPLSSAAKSNLTTTLDYVRNDTSNPYHNPDFISLVYQVPFEHGANQITSLLRSGTTLTIACDAPFNTQLGNSTGISIRGLTGDHAVYNFDMTVTANVSVNTSTRIVTVSNLVEPQASGTTALDTSRNGACYGYWVDHRDTFIKIGEENWWTRRVGTGGYRYSWSTAFSAFDVNNTEWAPVDGDGKNYAAWLATYGHTQFGGIPGLSGFFQDNVIALRNDVGTGSGLGDWNRDGVQEDKSTAQASNRAGLARYAQQMRLHSQGYVIMANADNDLSESGWLNVYDMALFEHAHRFTTAQCIARINQRNFLIGPRIALYGARSESAYGGTAQESDYSTMRRHLARALAVGFNAFCFNGASQGYVVSVRHDEMDAPLGMPVDPPVVANNAGAGSRCMLRRFSNGLVVFNNTNAGQSDTVNIAALGSYRKLSSADIGRTPLDSFNDGSVVTSLTLAAGQGGSHIGEGAILIKV